MTSRPRDEELQEAEIGGSSSRLSDGGTEDPAGENHLLERSTTSHDPVVEENIYSPGLDVCIHYRRQRMNYPDRKQIDSSDTDSAIDILTLP